MPKTDTTVAELVSMIKNGELRLPEMQRRYVWPATRVRDLLDSLYRGYPSGMILVWETDREMPSRDLAVSQEQSPFRGHKLLLDGQQRLTSLYAILRAEPVVVRGRKRPIELLFNLEHPDGPPTEVLEVEDDTRDLDESEMKSDEEDETPNIQERLKQLTFVVASRALLADPHWIRMSDIFKDNASDGQILKGLVKSLDDPLFDKYSNRLQRVRKIRDYPYVMHVIEKELSYQEVAEIFVRVNSLGMKLRGSDLALALITSRWQDSLNLFEGFQEECEEKWFSLDLGLIIRALVVFATGQSRFRTVGTIPVNSLKLAWEEAKEGMRFAINFLRSNAGLEDASLMSSPLFAITLAYYSTWKGYRFTPEEEGKLKRWFYIANTRGHYSRGSSETILDVDLSAIKKGGTPTELLEILRQQIGRLEIEPSDLVGRGLRGGLFPMAYVALKARGAKDWRTRLALSLTHQGKYHSVEYHHIFPKSLLNKAGYETADINEIANLAFVSGRTNRRIASSPPEKYLPEVLREQGKEALESHCIPSDSNLWKVESFSQFLEYRRKALAEAINEFIAKAEVEAGTAVNILELIAAGESDQVELKASARWDYREQKQNAALGTATAKVLAGFLNGKGGALILGVDDSGRIVGLQQDYATLNQRPDRDGYQQFLVNLISSMLGKDVFGDMKISFQEEDAKDVCLIKVRPSLKPVFLRDGKQNIFYVRTGNTTQALDVEEASKYIKAWWKN